MWKGKEQHYMQSIIFYLIYIQFIQSLQMAANRFLLMSTLYLSLLSHPILTTYPTKQHSQKGLYFVLSPRKYWQFSPLDTPWWRQSDAGRAVCRCWDQHSLGGAVCKLHSLGCYTRRAEGTGDNRLDQRLRTETQQVKSWFLHTHEEVLSAHSKESLEILEAWAWDIEGARTFVWLKKKSLYYNNANWDDKQNLIVNFEIFFQCIRERCWSFWLFFLIWYSVFRCYLSCLERLY